MQLKTGKIEVIASKIVLINEAQTTPMIIDDNTDALEDTRLKYRYLDLRRPCMQEILHTRAKIVKAVHEYLRKDKRVEKYEIDIYNDGATIVKLKEE